MGHEKYFKARHIHCTLIDDRASYPRGSITEQRRCHCLVNFWMRKVTISESHLLTRDYVRSKAAFFNEKRKHMKSKHWYIIHPFSQFRIFWDCLMTVIFFYSLIECPLNAMFFIERLWGHWIYYWQCFRITVDCICILDIIFTLITGYYVYETKQLVLEPNEIFWNYFRRGRFFCELLAALPLQSTMVLIYPKAPFTTLRMWLFVEYISLLQLLRVIKIRYVIQNAVIVLEKKFFVSEIFIVVTRFFFVNLVVIHWFACLYYFVPKIRMYNEHEIFKTSWITRKNLQSSGPLTLYMHSLLETMFLFLHVECDIDQPVNVDETVIQTVILLAGYIFIWYIIISCLWVLSIQQTASLQYGNVIQQLKDYMIHNTIPSYLQQRIIMGFNYRFRNQYFRENIILTTLPENMKNDIKIYTSRRIIKRCPIFSFLSRSDVEEVMQCVQSELYLPNDVILQTNIENNSMFLVNSGTVSIFAKNGDEICHLEDGDHFGEYGLLRETKYLNQDCNITAVAVTITELLRIKKTDFDRILQSKEKVVEYFHSRAENYFTRILARENSSESATDIEEYFHSYYSS